MTSPCVACSSMSCVQASWFGESRTHDTGVLMSATSRTMIVTVVWIMGDSLSMTLTTQSPSAFKTVMRVGLDPTRPLACGIEDEGLEGAPA